MINIYVGSVPYAATETDLEELFEPHGPLRAVTIIRDRYDGRSKGYGFVEMENQEDGKRAIEALDGHELMGRPLKVNPARPRGDRKNERQDRKNKKGPTSKNISSKSKTSSDGSFHNPYAFVPSPPREKAIKHGGFAGDFNPLKHDPPLDHASLKPDLWTGHIPIKITTVTPLVLLKDDGRERKPAVHQVYDVHSRIPEPSLRGMLRNAYEVITNSRYSCFRNDEKLKYRMGREKRTYEKSPVELLACSLKPASKLNELSPVDRLFGWTPQEDGNEDGYKSRIRVVCDGNTTDTLDEFDNTLPLAILGEPKPAQGRFYVAEDGQGTPQADGLSKGEAGYSEGKGLRGRKHYWHHKGLEEKNAPDYWKLPAEDRTQKKTNGRFQEYRRPNKYNNQTQQMEKQIDSQNRSIKGWIKPNKEFKASLYVQNLQSKEVGALLWLLTRPKDQYYKLGYGKPLGFGSVRLEVESGPLPLATGAAWKKYYAAFETLPPIELDENQRSICIQAFKASMESAYKEHPSFKNLPFISDFLQILKGPIDDVPIHYPRLDQKPTPEGKNFEWFVQNERGKKRALPDVNDENGLPYRP